MYHMWKELRAWTPQAAPESDISRSIDISYKSYYLS